jgi:hypothetical protein
MYLTSLESLAIKCSELEKEVQRLTASNASLTDHNERLATARSREQKKAAFWRDEAIQYADELAALGVRCGVPS